MRHIHKYILVFFIFSACSLNEKKSGDHEKSRNRLDIKYARGFSVEYFPGYKKISVYNPWKNNDLYIEYYLLKDDVTLPEPSNSLALVIKKKPERTIVLSSTQIGMMKMLDLTDRIAGICDPTLIYDSTYQTKVSNGKLVNVGKNPNLNIEKIIEMNPDLIIGSGWDRISADYQKFIELGFPPVLVLEWMESYPLGRAEWIKFISAFFDKEKLADSIFSIVENEYILTKKMIDTVSWKPVILHGGELNGVWYVAGGLSYIARLYADAGGDYPWKDNKNSGGLPLDFEVVIEKAADADIWIYVTMHNYEDIEHLKQKRYRIFKAKRQGNIYSNNARVNPLGGSDYWETGIIRPDILLKDLVKIFHPDLLNDHKLYYYRKIDLNYEN